MEIKTHEQLFQDFWEALSNDRWVSAESILERLEQVKKIQENAEETEEAWNQICDFLNGLEKELRDKDGF